ncbi:MAG: CBS domain-containing protein [Armatimonadetes bacterium]|nr:CBS domain-containing protein [Armatimonadota bacterium]
MYLSQILDRPILDARGDVIGTLGDLVIDQSEVFPRITGLAIKGDRSRISLIPWEAVERLDASEVRLRAERYALKPRPLQPEEFLLADEVLDKQVVDIDGLKVVRVNDLQLALQGGALRLVAADVGSGGLLRRLNLEGAARRVGTLLRRPLADRLIPWNMVATLGGPRTPLKLKISREKLRDIHPADLGDLLEELDRDDRVEMLAVLEEEAAAEALAEAEPEVQVDIVKSLPSEKAADLLEEMSPDDAAGLVRDLPEEKASEIISLMEPEEAQEVKELLRYPEGTVGSHMNTEHIALPETLTVEETIQRLRDLAPGAETIYYLYVVDGEGRLVGVLSLRSLIIAPPQTRLSEIMERDVIAAYADDPEEEAASVLEKYDLLGVPVMDRERRLLGVVTIDDVMDLVMEKASPRPRWFSRRWRRAP